MNKTKLALAMSLSALLATGCGSSSSGGGGEDVVATTYDVENTYWDLAADADDAATKAVDVDDIIAYYFDSENDVLKIYQSTGYTNSTYTISDDDDDASNGSIVVTVDTDEITCDFGVVDEQLTLSNCDNPDYDAADIGIADEARIAELEEFSEIVDDDTPVTDEDLLAAQILDTDTGVDGELRIKLSEMTDVTSITEGQVSATLILQPDADTTTVETDAITNTAYVSLYGASTGSGDLHGDIIFSGGEVKYRDADKAQHVIDGLEYTEGTEIEFVATWDAAGYSLSIDGGESFSGPYTGISTDAVEVIAFKLGTSSDVSEDEFIVDDIEILDAGSSIYSEDFESYTAGDDLVGNPFNSSSSEATVVGEETDATDPGTTPVVDATIDNFDDYTVGDQIDSANSAYVVSSVDGETLFAEISDDVTANSGSNTLYLEDNSGSGKPVVARSFADGVADSGSVSVSVYIPANGYVKSSYIYLGSSESGSQDNRFTEVVFGSSAVKFRNESGSQKSLHDYDPDTWVDVTVAWEGTAVTVTVDGSEYTTYDDAPLVAENDDEAGPSLIALYVGDTSTSGTYTYFDDLESSLFETSAE